MPPIHEVESVRVEGITRNILSGKEHSLAYACGTACIVNVHYLAILSLSKADALAGKAAALGVEFPSLAVSNRFS